MIRIRRIPKRVLHRPRCEVEYRPVEIDQGWSRVPAHPVLDLERIIGTGDAWALIRAADNAWDGTVGQWILLDGPGEDS